MPKAAGATPPAPKGFVCPNCGGPLPVVKTRKRARGVVCRRRRCPLCLHAVTTEERPRPPITGHVHR